MPSRAVTIYPHRPHITVLIGLDRDLQAVLGEGFGQAVPHSTTVTALAASVSRSRSSTSPKLPSR